MFSTKNPILTHVSITAMLLFVSTISASHIHSSCFLLSKCDPLKPTLQDDTRRTGIVWHAAQNGCAYQGWWLRGYGDTFTITNMGTFRVLDSNQNGQAYTSQLNSGLFQRWRWNGDCLQNVATGLYLTIHGNSVRTMPYTGEANQLWERRHETQF